MFSFFAKKNFKISLDNHALIWKKEWPKRAPERWRSAVNPRNFGAPNSPEPRPAIGIEIRSILAEQKRIELTKKQLDSQRLGSLFSKNLPSLPSFQCKICAFKTALNSTRSTDFDRIFCANHLPMPAEQVGTHQTPFGRPKPAQNRAIQKSKLLMMK